MGQVLSSLEIIVTAHYNLSKGLSMLFRDERYLCKIAVFLFLCISPNSLLSNEKVIYGKEHGIHVSGHGCQEDQLYD